MTQHVFLLAGISSLLIAGTSALASNGEAKGEAPKAAVSANATVATADQAAPPDVVAAPDPVTPFTLEGTDLGRMLNRDATNVSVMRLRGGAMRLDVGGGFRSVLVVRITPEGKAETSCIMSEKAAERIFAPQRNKTPQTRQEP